MNKLQLFATVLSFGCLTTARTAYVRDIPRISRMVYTDTREVDCLAQAFRNTGWICQTTELDDHVILLVKDSTRPWYAFIFERRGASYLRFSCSDANLVEEHCLAGNSDAMWFDHGDWRRLVAYAKSAKIATDSIAKTELVWAKASQPAIEGVVRPENPRKLTADEGRRLVRLLAESDTVYKEFTSDKGKSVDGLPPGTTMKSGWMFGDYACLQLQSKEYAGVGFYPFVIRLGKYSLRLLWNWPEDSASLALSPGFPEIIQLCEKAGLTGLWNSLNEHAGQAGLWFRSEMSRPPKASACEAGWITRTGYPTLAKIGKESRMTAFAQCGKWKVAQMYEGETLHYVELSDDSVVADLDLEKAIESVNSTKDLQLLACYELVCRQVGHPDLCLALYENPLHISL